jgi:hypothetical protein
VVVTPVKGTLEPPKVAVMSELAAKPEPDTVTEEPTSPLDGLKVIVASANVVVAVFVPSVAVTV